MISSRTCTVVCLLLLGSLPTVEAAPPADTQAIARKLLATTVTVRISTPAAPAGPTMPGGGRLADNAIAEDSVSLASGVSLGKGLVISFCNCPTTSRYRVTLPDGDQAEAVLRVADEYSGLRLVEIDHRDLPALELAAEPPTIGMPILTAAAMGLEKPAVSLGIVGGIDRALGGTGLPPLLLCDVRTTDTSIGAAVVNADGKLIGIVAATPAAADRPGWTFAVPVRHVERVLAARIDKRLVVLRRQRPTAGLTLGPGRREGVVQVERVEAGGPADQAGIRTGDLVLEAEGHKIRSAYQAVDVILKKQPGEEVRFLVEQAGQPKQVELKLGGAANIVAGGSDGAGAAQVGPQLNVRVVRPDQVEVRRGDRVAEYKLGTAEEAAATAPPRDEAAVLKARLAAFDSAIRLLRDEIRRRDLDEARTQQRIKELTAEVEKLRKQLEAKP